MLVCDHEAAIKAKEIDVDLRDLEVFVEVARLGGFNRASAQLHTAQSALSRRVANLEHQMGTPLLVRSKRGVRTTPAGAILLERAQGLLQQFEQVKSEMLSEAGVPRGILSIGIPPSLLTNASRMLAIVKSRFPLVFVRAWVATTVDLRSMLVAGKLDVAIYASLEADPVVKSQRLFDDHVCLICPRDAHLPGKADWEQIAALPLMLPGRPNTVRLLVEAAAAKRGLRLNVILEANDVSLLLELASSGAGSTILPQSAANGADLRRVSLISIPDLRLRWVVATLKERSLSVASLRTVEVIRELIDSRVLSAT
jgi:LysR family nitrogen assimilation transcriptional regulator